MNSTDVMVVEDQRALLEHFALRRLLDHALQAHHAFLARERQQLVHHREQVEVVLLLVARAFQQRDEAAGHLLGDPHRVGDDQRADRGAADDQQLGRLPQSPQLPAVHGEPPQDATENDDDADD